MSSTKLNAEVRQVLGSKVKTLRANGLIPANIYGKNVESLSIQIKADEFRKAFSEAGETGLIELSVDGKARPVLVDNIQVHPVTDEILHVDLKQVNLREKVTANVPLEFVGEAPAEKLGLVVMQQLTEVEVEALPAELPEKIEVDLSSLVDAEGVIMIKDLKIPSEVELQADAELIVVNVTEPKEEVMEVVEQAEEGETKEETKTEEASEESSEEKSE